MYLECFIYNSLLHTTIRAETDNRDIRLLINYLNSEILSGRGTEELFLSNVAQKFSFLQLRFVHTLVLRYTMLDHQWLFKAGM